MKVNQEIDLHRISNLLCDALEGGSNYWYTIKEFIEPTNTCIPYSCAAGEEGEIFKHLDYPLNEGGALIIVDKEDDDAKEYRLDLKSIETGLQTMADKFPYHWANFINENDDADTGDCFLQCCLFGDIIYE